MGSGELRSHHLFRVTDPCIEPLFDVGQMGNCAGCVPNVERDGGFLRIGLAHYNTQEEVMRFLGALGEIST